MDTRRKLFTGKVVEADQGGPIVAVVSTEAPDMIGDVMIQGANDRGKGWLLKDFNSRGRVYWMHDPFRPNLAKASAKVDGKQLLLSVEFDMADPFAAELDRKYREGYLTEWSVGFKPTSAEKMESNEHGGSTFFEQELYEVSAVNQGMNPGTGVISKAYAEYVEAIDQFKAFDNRLREVEAVIMRAETARANEIKTSINKAMEALRLARISV